MSSSASEKKIKEMINRSTQTFITNEDFIQIDPQQRTMSNEEFLNMFYNRANCSQEEFSSFIKDKHSNYTKQENLSLYKRMSMKELS